MITKDKIQALLHDIESDRVERTISTTNIDKFGEAICSFSNDLPDNQKPGYLIIGADDKTGKVMPINITDALLKNVAAIRTEGNIQPQPSMTVEKIEFDDGSVVVVEVQPALFPPVRYKGDYEGNGPIQFYQYDDRIEILNPGGQYGKANPNNFPLVNDYRNGVIAEAMKVMGFVNRFSRGVQRVQEELRANANGEADFKLDLETAFLVKVNISPKVLEAKGEAKDEAKGEAKDEAKDETVELSDTASLVFQYIKENPNITRKEMSLQLNVSVSKIYRAITELKQKGYIKRLEGRKLGHWEIFNKEITTYCK